MLDFVTHDDTRPALPAVHLEDRTTLTYGELAELVGEFERALRCDGKALVLCAGDRDLPTLLAYLAALRLGHAVAFLLWRDRGDRRDAGPRRRKASPAWHGRSRLPHQNPHSGRRRQPDPARHNRHRVHAAPQRAAVAVPRTLGSVVGAHVVLRPGASVRKAELAVHCGRRLAGHKIAKHFMFVDQVLRSAAGKVQRWRLALYHENGATPP
jgi:acyl-CoA synthetase (AMP-forming)/AMP-acid ligase II